MPELILTDEQVAAYAEAMGVEPDDVTPETLAAYMEEQATKLAEKEEEARSFAESELGARLLAAEKRAEDAETKADAADRRFYEQDRDRLIDSAIESFKIDPAKREDWIARYDENAELTRTFIEELPENEELSKMYGDDEPTGGEEMDRMYAAWAAASGAPVPEGSE